MILLPVIDVRGSVTFNLILVHIISFHVPNRRLAMGAYMMGH